MTNRSKHNPLTQVRRGTLWCRWRVWSCASFCYSAQCPPCYPLCCMCTWTCCWAAVGRAQRYGPFCPLPLYRVAQCRVHFCTLAIWRSSRPARKKCCLIQSKLLNFFWKSSTGGPPVWLRGIAYPQTTWKEGKQISSFPGFKYFARLWVLKYKN